MLQNARGEPCRRANTRIGPSECSTCNTSVFVLRIISGFWLPITYTESGDN